MLRRYSSPAIEPQPNVPRSIASTSALWQPAFTRARIRYRILPYLNSRQPDHKHGPLAPPKRRKEIQQLFPREILLVEQLHSVGSLFARDDFGSRVHPFPEHPAAHVTRRNSHTRIVANAFYFSARTDRVHVKLRRARIEAHRWLRHKPHRSL